MVMYSAITLILSIFMFSACGITSKKEKDSALFTISLHCTIHKPYCGGAKPTAEIAAGYDEPMKLEKFKLIKGKEYKEGMAVFQDVTLDEAGNTNLQLEKGEYMLLRADKFLALDDFIKENGAIEKVNYQLKDNLCFSEWKNTVDKYFTVEKDASIEIHQKAKCWVGTNPCLIYIGPLAP